MLAVVDEARVRAGDGHAAWSESFNEMFAQAAGVFGNAAVRRHGRAYLLGLLSHTERLNSWSLAEFAGDVSPDGMQRLLNFSPWDEGGCRDAVRRYVVRNLGGAGSMPGSAVPAAGSRGTASIPGTRRPRRARWSGPSPRCAMP